MSGLNTNMLERIISVLETDPRCLYMHGWVYRLPHEANVTRRPIPTCGTIGCIAGWAWLLNAPEGIPSENPGGGVVSRGALEILGITKEQGDKLFFIMNWPLEYSERYDQADSDPEKETRVTIDLLREVVKRGEIWW